MPGGLGDVRLVHEALKYCRNESEVVVARNGTEAVELLDAIAAAGSLPTLILLDLNLPEFHGFELLKKIKSDARLKIVPTVVFSSSENPEDSITALELSANAYVVKPKEIDLFFEAIRTVHDFWIKKGSKQNENESCLGQS